MGGLQAGRVGQARDLCARGGRQWVAGRVLVPRRGGGCGSSAACARARALGLAHERCDSLVEHVARELVGDLSWRLLVCLKCGIVGPDVYVNSTGFKWVTY